MTVSPTASAARHVVQAVPRLAVVGCARLVVAQVAGEEALTARRQHLTVPLVVRAARRRWLGEAARTRRRNGHLRSGRHVCFHPGRGSFTPAAASCRTRQAVCYTRLGAVICTLQQQNHNIKAPQLGACLLRTCGVPWLARAAVAAWLPRAQVGSSCPRVQPAQRCLCPRAPPRALHARDRLRIIIRD